MFLHFRCTAYLYQFTTNYGPLSSFICVDYLCLTAGRILAVVGKCGSGQLVICAVQFVEVLGGKMFRQTGATISRIRTGLCGGISSPSPRPPRATTPYATHTTAHICGLEGGGGGRGERRGGEGGHLGWTVGRPSSASPCPPLTPSHPTPKGRQDKGTVGIGIGKGAPPLPSPACFRPHLTPPPRPVPLCYSNHMSEGPTPLPFPLLLFAGGASGAF